MPTGWNGIDKAGVGPLPTETEKYRCSVLRLNILVDNTITVFYRTEEALLLKVEGKES